MKRLLTLLFALTIVIGHAQIMPGVLQQAANLRNATPASDSALLLVWDDISNVPMGGDEAESLTEWNSFFGLVNCPENSDAPAPSNITITPDAVGSNPVTWYYTTCYIDAGFSTRSLFSTESSFIMGDATTEVIFDSDVIPDWAVYCSIFLGTSSGVYTHYIEVNLLPFDIFIFIETPGVYDMILALPIHQTCTTNGTPFTSVEVVGDTVKLYGGSGITLRGGLFSDNATTAASIIEVIDEADCVDSLECLCDEETDATSTPFYYYYPEPEVENACTNLTIVDLPLVTAVGESCFRGCTSLTTIYIPLCATLGTSTGYDDVFENIKALNIIVTCPASLLTCNEGSPDADLCYLNNNNTITVNGSPFVGCP